MSTLPRGLFPEIEPRASGMLRLDDLHEMYWEECGNPAGIPVVFLHGGPGAHLDYLLPHLLDLADEDAAAYDTFATAMKLPRETDEQKAACVRNVREATMMRRLYLDGVWRTFVEKAAEKKLAA